MVILELIHAHNPFPREADAVICLKNQSGLRVGQLVTLNNRSRAHGLVPAPDLSSV